MPRLHSVSLIFILIVLIRITVCFLAPEVENYKKRYGATFGANLKAGNLSGPYEIHAQYQQRLHQFYTYMLE